MKLYYWQNYTGNILIEKISTNDQEDLYQNFNKYMG